MRIYLLGVACVGKTTIGALLARRLGSPFFDLWEEVEKHFGASIERLQAAWPGAKAGRSWPSEESCCV